MSLAIEHKCGVAATMSRYNLGATVSGRQSDDQSGGCQATEIRGDSVPEVMASFLLPSNVLMVKIFASTPSLNAVLGCSVVVDTPSRRTSEFVSSILVARCSIIYLWRLPDTRFVTNPLLGTNSFRYSSSVGISNTGLPWSESGYVHLY